MDCTLLDDLHVCNGAGSLFLERPAAPAVLLLAARLRRRCRGPSIRVRQACNIRELQQFRQAQCAGYRASARVLAAVPDSRLLLKWRSLADPQLQTRLRRRFAECGIDGERIQFAGACEHADMLREYGNVDVALDPFPFCGGVTSCEALWMGVPVVTLAGSRPFSRQTHAVLHTIGRPEWSAGSAEEYVAIAAGLVRNPAALPGIRLGLRQEMLTSPLCDGPGLARSLECVYRELWLDYLADC